jgi:hypothetical protein
MNVLRRCIALASAAVSSNTWPKRREQRDYNGNGDGDGDEEARLSLRRGGVGGVPSSAGR